MFRERRGSEMVRASGATRPTRRAHARSRRPILEGLEARLVLSGIDAAISNVADMSSYTVGSTITLHHHRAHSTDLRLDHGRDLDRRLGHLARGPVQRVGDGVGRELEPQCVVDDQSDAHLGKLHRRVSDRARHVAALDHRHGDRRRLRGEQLHLDGLGECPRRRQQRERLFPLDGHRQRRPLDARRLVRDGHLWRDDDPPRPPDLRRRRCREQDGRLPPRRHRPRPRDHGRHRPRDDGQRPPGRDRRRHIHRRRDGQLRRRFLLRRIQWRGRPDRQPRPADPSRRTINPKCTAPPSRR